MSSPSLRPRTASADYASVLAIVIQHIRSVIDEDWIHHFEITADSRFNDDLEIESIEFMKITDAVQGYYGAQLDIVGWLSSMTIHDLIHISVGDLTGHIVGALSKD